MSSKPPGKLRQIGQMVVLTAKADKRYVPIVATAVVVTVVVVFLLFSWLLNPVVGGILAVLSGLIAFTSVTGRRGQSAAFANIEGQPGAAAAVLNSLRGDWRVTPAVAFNRNQDLVHRAIGRAGVVLVAEGSGGARTRELLSGELKKVRRALGPDAPLHDIVVGNGEGQVPLKRLNVHVMKLPRTLKPREVNVIDSRLKALGGPSMPLPKGPLPTRMPRGGKMR
ncbi:MAG TPA: DUF4191 domain-containing protein [Mycobacteriales bacterium]|jgi:hypothetical protein